MAQASLFHVGDVLLTRRDGATIPAHSRLTVTRIIPEGDGLFSYSLERGNRVTTTSEIMLARLLEPLPDRQG